MVDPNVLVSAWISPHGIPPKDDYLVALALESDAEFLVSGDHHLVETPLGEGVSSVLTPGQFIGLLERDDS